GLKAYGCTSARPKPSRTPKPRSGPVPPDRGWSYQQQRISVATQSIPHRAHARAMTQCNRYGSRPTRLHDSSVGAVPADADRSLDAGPAGLGLQAWRRSAGAGVGHDLSADTARLPAG